MDQNDIDAMLNNIPEPSPGGDATDDFSVDGMLSQADIDAALTGGAMAPPPAPPPDVLDSTGKPMDDFAKAMAEALAEEHGGANPFGGSSHEAAPSPAAMQLPAFSRDEIIAEVSQPVSLLHDVQLHVKIELGRTQMFVEDVLRLGEGSVVELDRLAGDPVDVYVNNRLVARGEVLVLNDNFCVRVSEIISEMPVRMTG
jgi:flagellar motor switch protein FliN/FliY